MTEKRLMWEGANGVANRVVLVDLSGDPVAPGGGGGGGSGAAGQYSTPELRTDGRSYRIVQTLGGASPSFTRSVVRNSLPFQQARHIAQSIDRTVSLTTLGAATPALYVDGAADLHLVVNIGAATTPPALQLQVSEDNGATWASVGSPVTATASGTVKAKVTGEYPRHARAIVTTAGAGVTMGYVLVKAVG